MNTFKQFVSVAAKSMKKYSKSKLVSKENVFAYLQYTIKELQANVLFFDGFSINDFAEMGAAFQSKLFLVKDPYLRNYYQSVVKRGLTGKALSKEQRHFLKALKSANKAALKILEAGMKNFDNLYAKESIVVNDIRLSQLTFFGFITNGALLASSISYIITFISNVISKEEQNVNKSTTFLKPYQLDELKLNQKQFIFLVNFYNNDTQVKALKTEKKPITPTYDFTLGAISSPSSPLGILSNLFNKNKSLSFGLIGYLNIFKIISIIADSWNQYSYRKNAKTKLLKEWMEQRTALLKLELAEGDIKNQAKKEELKKIIARYEDMIAQYDREIHEYEEDAEELITF